MKDIKTLVYYKEPEALIPTRGLPTHVNDIYRADGYFRASDPDLSEGVIFSENYNDIGVFENEISSFEDLLRFESILRFILLRENLFVLEPSVRVKIVNTNSSLETYQRIPKYSLESSDFVFQKSKAFNRLFPIEKLTIEKGVVTKTTNPESIYLNVKQSELSQLILRDKLSLSFLKTIPQSLSVPFISNNPNNLNNPNNFKEIFSDFLSSLDFNFSEKTKYEVKYGYNIALPFFSNAVFSIAKGRDDIPNAILELRNDLEPLRNKLHNFELQFKGIKSTRELALLSKGIESTIDSYTKNIYEAGTKLSDMIRLGISLFSNPNETIGKIFNPQYSLNNDYPVLFGESNYHRMKRIISKENINSNIEHILSKTEMEKIKAQL